MNEKEAIIIINRFKGITTAPVNTEEVRGACRLAIEALRKQVPRKPNVTDGVDPDDGAITTGFECPVCKIDVSALFDNYCYNCGQALEWEE